MADQGYCTVPDVRRALQETVAEFDSLAWGENNNEIVVDAITSQTEWLHETTNRHWYEPNGIAEDDHGIIPTGPKTHSEDEQDVPTRSFLTTEPESRDNTFLFGTNDADESIPSGGLQPKQFAGTFTRLTLYRRDVTSLSELLVLTTEGYEDWVASSEYTEGRTGDYYLHSDDSNGLTRLYLDTASMDSELENYSSAVVATYDWGIEGLSDTLRRAVGMKAAAQLLAPDDEAALGIPENASLQSAESKVQALERQAEELLEIHQ